MVYCNLKGGLGNMLFQIAATKAIAIKKNIDCSFPNFQEHLNVINQDNVYNPSIKHAKEYNNFLFLNNFKPTNACKAYTYPFEYIEFIPIENEFIIDGFFQTEKYFIDQRAEILSLIQPTEEIEKLINNKYGFINNTNSTSLHIRRGDYLKFTNHHPTQTLEYYYKAINMLPNTEIFIVFSDDIEWCKDNFKFKNVYFIENEKDYIELFLMSKCKNNIIANSSFSWWGAWLNINENKTIIGPKKWFGNNLSHLNTNDILCKTWVAL